MPACRNGGPGPRLRRRPPWPAGRCHTGIRRSPGPAALHTGRRCQARQSRPAPGPAGTGGPLPRNRAACLPRLPPFSHTGSSGARRRPAASARPASTSCPSARPRGSPAIRARAPRRSGDDAATGQRPPAPPTAPPAPAHAGSGTIPAARAAGPAAAPPPPRPAAPGPVPTRHRWPGPGTQSRSCHPPGTPAPAPGAMQRSAGQDACQEPRGRPGADRAAGRIDVPGAPPTGAAGPLRRRRTGSPGTSSSRNDTTARRGWPGRRARTCRQWTAARAELVVRVTGHQPCSAREQTTAGGDCQLVLP
jgi:hypothetical protein